MKPLLGAVADDFTGATDLANMLARAGMRTVLALGAPTPGDPVPEAEAVVAALKSRTAPVPEAVDESLTAWRWLAEGGAEQCYFKYCSTFDSTPKGNIGPVAAALMEETGADFTVYCPAFPEAGRTIYRGHLFVFDQPLHESPLKDHPLTPMTDANLMRWLSPQLGGAEVGLIGADVVDQGADAIRAAMDALKAKGIRHAVVDALNNDHLEALGRASAGMPLVTAGSGLGLGLPGTFAGRLAGGAADALPAIGGPALLLSGSCSAATNAQVARWEADGGALLRMDPLAVAEGRSTAEGLWTWASNALKAAPGALIAATQPPDAVRAVQQTLGTERAAALVEETLSAVAQAARAAGIRRFIVAGGETSGAVTSALGISRLAVGPQIAPGVPWCATIGDDPTALALKSGNFGAETFFQDALESAP
ncbi:MAG: 3-oxo-tetronate kinase [Pseudomonadota bacterium]